MKKWTGMIVTVIFLLCFAGPLGAQTVIKWKLVSTWTPAINLIEADKHFAKLVEEMSAGKMQISVHPAGELVPAMQVFDAVSNGTFEMGGEWPNYWAGKNTAFDLLGSYPLGPGQYDYLNWYYHGGGKAIYDWLYGKNNMLYFSHAITPMESGIRSVVPIKTLADYKGKKLRMSGKAQGHILQKLGASQVMLAGGEIYQALQMKTLDGAEFSSPSIDWGMGFAEVTKFHTGPGWHQPASLLGVMISKGAWEKLPADLKVTVARAADANMAYMSSYYEHLNIKALADFEKAGTKTFKLTDKEMDILEGYSWEYLIDESKRNPDFAKAALAMFQYLKDFRQTRYIESPFGHGRPWKNVPALPGLK